MDANLRKLQSNLGVAFNEPILLQQALTHRSYINENPEATEDNERLEFLGDAVLDYLVGEYLYHNFKDIDEGGLTSLRAALVRSETLAQFAKDLGVGNCLRLGHGEAKNGGRERTATLCGTFEAIVGAMTLDQGIESARPLTEALIKPAIEHILNESLHKDAKSEFQVWAQASLGDTPHYEVIKAEGPDHAKTFTMEVWVGGQRWGEGSGRSKQIAAQAAAREAIKQAESAGVRGIT